MSYTPDKLVSFAARFEQISEESLEKSAKKKEKVDPKAKVRNRGSVCVPAESAKDKKDHFPINDEAQARNALARVHQYSSTPEWYSGSLKGLQALVARKVKAKYPKIDVGGKDSKKKKSAYYEAVLVKFAQAVSKEDLLMRLNAYSKELPDKKRRNADNEPKQLAYDAAIEAMKEAIDAANKDDFNTAYNRLSFATGKINRSGVVDPSFEEYAGNLLRSISEYRKQPAAAPATKPADGGDQKYWDDKAKWQAGQKPSAPAAKSQTPARKPTPYREEVHTAQQKLNSMIQGGKLNAHPLDPDGKLGNLTRGVLKSYKEYIGVPHLTDEEAIKALNTAKENPLPSGFQQGPTQTWATPPATSTPAAPAPAAAPGQTTT